MNKVFADTLFWVALELQNDPWHELAVAAEHQLDKTTVVTTDDVLVEFLATLSGSGIYYRQRAAQTVRDIIASDEVKVLPQSHQSFLEGLAFYERRFDKGYSLTDCISMNACRNEGITKVLTNDHHFEQEGFTVLIT